MDPLIPCGSPAPNFSLPDLNGCEHKLTEGRGRIVVLSFWSAECPWSERSDQELQAEARAWGGRVLLWTIASNANEPYTLISAESSRRGLSPVLLDRQQKVADLYGAQTTPHLFVIDETGLLCYQGALDDVTFRRRTPSVAYLRLAVEALLDGRRPTPAETPPYGCTIFRAHP